MSYDMRSNIKGKPGSQGTLFQVTDKSLLNPMQRWPRGYTPERQREVDSALPHVFGMQIPPRESFNDQTGKFDFEYPQARDVVRTAVSRSTVPVEHLQGLTRIGPNVGEGRAGVYWQRGKDIHLDYNRPRHDVERTLIHEIGHHADNMTKPQPEPGTWREPGDKDHGIAEAVADNYQQKHFRPLAKHADKPDNTYDTRFTQEHLDRVYAGYTDVRPPKANKNLGPQWTQERLF